LAKIDARNAPGRLQGPGEIGRDGPDTALQRGPASIPGEKPPVSVKGARVSFGGESPSAECPGVQANDNRSLDAGAPQARRGDG